MVLGHAVYFRQLTINPCILYKALTAQINPRKAVQDTIAILEKHAISDWYIAGPLEVKLNNSFLMLPVDIANFLFDAINFEEVVTRELGYYPNDFTAQLVLAIGKEFCFIPLGNESTVLTTMPGELFKLILLNQFKQIKQICHDKKLSESGMMLKQIQFWNRVAIVTSQFVGRYKLQHK